MGKVEQVSTHILCCLLQDFQARELGADALEQEYVGVPMNDLKRMCFSNDHTCTTVDFDLALKELEARELIGTGPMDAIENPPGADVIFVGLYSKREYVFLTEEGYKASR